MKKKYPYNVMSDEVCRTCGCKLKLRIVENKPTVRDCYLCYSIRQTKRGKAMGIFGNPRKKRILAGLPVRTYYPNVKETFNL